MTSDPIRTQRFSTDYYFQDSYDLLQAMRQQLTQWLPCKLLELVIISVSKICLPSMLVFSDQNAKRILMLRETR